MMRALTSLVKCQPQLKKVCLAIGIKSYEEEMGGFNFIQLMIRRMESRKVEKRTKADDAKLKQALLELLIAILELGYHRHYFRPVDP